MNLYAPAPGSHSGVADYAAALHPAILQHGTPPVPLYHLGNNRLHSEIYKRALSEPGVIVLHDAVLHHFLLGTLNRDEYIGEFIYNYGEWNRQLAEDLWEGRGASGVDPRYFRYPMLRRIVERSRAVIVHNPGAARIPAVPARIIPHFFEPADIPDAADTARFRDRLNIPQGHTLFGIFGYLRETKRVLPSLKAFSRLHALRPNTTLLLAGEPASSDLSRLLHTEADRPGVIRLPHLAERELRIASAAIDCCINLRYPAAGETSGIAIRMMGIGKPVILTDNAENSDFPHTACFRVAAGVAETAELSDHMIMVTEFPVLARQIGAEARHHIAQHHTLAGAAQQYWETLCAAASQ